MNPAWDTQKQFYQHWWLCNSKDNNSHDPALLRSFVFSSPRYVLCFFFFHWFPNVIHVTSCGHFHFRKLDVDQSKCWGKRKLIMSCVISESLCHLATAKQNRSFFLMKQYFRDCKIVIEKNTLWGFVKKVLRLLWRQVKQVFHWAVHQKTAHQHPSDTPLLTFRLFFLKVAGITSFLVLRHIWGKCFGGQTPQWHTLNNKKNKTNKKNVIVLPQNIHLHQDVHTCLGLISKGTKD